MVKTKKVKIHQPLVIAGYTLFLLLIVATVLSTTIPFATILLHPNSIKINATVAMLALTIGAILPMLVGYFVGDHSVKSKSKLSHHFNGVLFGLLAYWIMILLSAFIPIPSQLFTDHNAKMILMNLLPSVGIGVVTTALAIAHVRSTRAGHDLLEYKPFAITLIISIIAMPIISLGNNIVTNSINVYSFVSLCIVVLLGLVSYVSLAKARLTAFVRLAWATVSVSVLFVALYVSFILESGITGYLMLYPTMEAQAAGGAIATVLALAGWLVYWILQVKALRISK